MSRTTKDFFPAQVVAGDHAVRLEWEAYEPIPGRSSRPVAVFFQIVEVASCDPGTSALYKNRDLDPVQEISDAASVASGLVCYDGCTTLDITDTHICSRQELDKLLEAVKYARYLCSQEMPDGKSIQLEYLS